MIPRVVGNRGYGADAAWFDMDYHRGKTMELTGKGRPQYRENTLLSCYEAYAEGCRCCLVDTLLNADNEPVLIHDYFVPPEQAVPHVNEGDDKVAIPVSTREQHASVGDEILHMSGTKCAEIGESYRSVVKGQFNDDILVPLSMACSSLPSDLSLMCNVRYVCTLMTYHASDTHFSSGSGVVVMCKRSITW